MPASGTHRPRSAVPRSVRVNLLGPVVCIAQGRSHPFPAQRPFQLLTCLAASAPWTPRDRLAALFWPDEANEDARRNLRRILHAARRLGFAPRIETRGDLLHWPVDTDLAEFERALANGGTAVALALVRGPLGAGLDDAVCAGFDAWLAGERQRVAERWRGAVLGLLPSLAPQAALEWSAHLLAHDAFDEDAQRARMQALVALGQPGEAKRVFRGFAEQLAEELGLVPSATTRAMAAAIDVDAAPASSRATAAARDAAALIGRESELAEVLALLALPETRLLTITGPGGVGKTRLARDMAAQIAAGGAAVRFADGTLWVDLFDLASADQIAPRLAAVLGLTLRPDSDALAQVASRLAATAQLLVLDNCEQLVAGGGPRGAAEPLAALITACPRLAVLATSRQRLGVAGERLVMLHGLDTAGAGAASGGVLTSAAALLFCARARAALAGFDGAGSEAAIAAICRLTDGLPLALELAAAWVGVMPCAEIAAELRAGLELLQPRHGDRGLRAAFQRSWLLAAPHERSVLACLSVLRGRFTLAAARAVAVASVPALANLVDASLLQVDAQGDAGRYSLHPLLREFVHEKLAADAAELAATQARHAEHFTRRLAEYGDFSRVDQQRALDEIGAMQEDCVAAWRWAGAAPAPRLLADAAIPLAYVFEERGRLAEGVALMREGLRVLHARHGHDRAHAEATAQIESQIAILQFRAGALPAAAQAARRVIEPARQAGLRRAHKSALNTLGLVAWHGGHWREARQHFSAALKLARVRSDGDGVAVFLGNVAMVEKAQGRLAAAEGHYREAVALHRAAEDQLALTTDLNNLGNLLRAAGRLDESLAALEETLALCEARGFKGKRPFPLVNLGRTWFELRRYDLAAEHGARALDAARSAGSAQVEANALWLLARLALQAGDRPLAHARLAEGLRGAVAAGMAPIRNLLLAGYGEWVASAGDHVRAVAIWRCVEADAQTEIETRLIVRAALRAARHVRGPATALAMHPQALVAEALAAERVTIA